MFRRMIIFLGIILLGNWPVLFPVSNPPTNRIVYISPIPGARHASTGTSIAIRAEDPFAPGAIPDGLFTIVGSQSGNHTGTVRVSDDNSTILFYPDEPFAYAEKVTVEFKAGLKTDSAQVVEGARFEFHTIDRPYSEFPQPQSTDITQSNLNSPRKMADHSYISYPELNSMMPFSLSVAANGAAPGYVFFNSSFGGPAYPPGSIIADDAGEPVFMRAEPRGFNVTDLKVQTVGGIPYLTYHVGTPIRVWSSGPYYQMDQSYTVVNTWAIGNGYGADEHEMQLLENGHALMLSYTPIPYDLSPFGGPANGVLVDILIQEQDSAKNVVFEWIASQHFPIASNIGGSLATSPSDYFHTNAIEVDTDGNILISSRHLSEITKIDRNTGAIIWHLGGSLNQFAFTNDDGFSYQHDIRRLPNQNITIFDNGNLKTPTPYSRAVEYTIDEQAKTVTRVWQYPGANPTGIYAPFMGNAQRLENGNTMIGWGAVPQITEAAPGGTIAFQLDLGGLTYRAYRFPWEAIPAAPPRLAVVPSQDQTTATLYFAWNGATQIDAYEIYSGAAAAPTSLVTTVARSGFETSVTLDTPDTDTCVFRVRPVHHTGNPMPYSNDAFQHTRPECLALLTHKSFMPLMSR